MSPPPLGAAEVNTIRIIGQYLKNLGLQYVIKHTIHFNHIISFSIGRQDLSRYSLLKIISAGVCRFLF